MNNFKEWLSDNLRYLLLGLIIILIIGAAILGIHIYSNIVGSTQGNVKETQKIEETESESKWTETQKTTEKDTEKTTEQMTEAQTGTEQLTETTATEEVTEAPVETEAVTEPETEPQTQAPTEPPEPTYLTMQGSCYLRAEPSMDAEIIGEYWAGTTVEFLEDVGGWYKVRVDGMTGYMGARFF